jgi:aconitate hydratase
MAFDLDMIKKVYDRYSTRVDAARKATGKHLTFNRKNIIRSP